jgi:hypothetical protein
LWPGPSATKQSFTLASMEQLRQTPRDNLLLRQQALRGSKKKTTSPTNSR